MFIAVSSVLTKQKFIIILPVFISLFINALQADANRYAYLVGSFNSLIYMGVSLYMGLYASAASNLLFSFPVQLLTFIRWSKNSYGNSTKFKKLSFHFRIGLCAMLVICFLLMIIILSKTGASYVLMDSAATLMSSVTFFLTMFAYVEYTYTWLISAVLQVALNIQVMLDNPSYVTYVIHSVYSTYCIVLAFINVRRLYNEQKQMQAE